MNKKKHVASLRGFILGCHPEFISGSSRYNNKMLKQVQHDGIKGFTLIELLVVVLIIGILAAVALPQYQKAVLKSRYSSLMPIAKSIANGNEAYYMEHGVYATSPANLDVAGQKNYPDGTKLDVSTGDYSFVIAGRDNNFPMNYIVYQKHSPKFAGHIHCEAAENNTMAQEVCQSLGGQYIDGSQSEGDYKTYILSGIQQPGDTFPTSMAKLKKQICGTTFDDDHCIVDDEANTITTKECGNNISYYNSYYNQTYTAKGCNNTVYDENRNSSQTITLCASGDFNETTGACSVNSSGSYQELTYNDEGKITAEAQCIARDNSTGKCVEISYTTCPSGSTSSSGIYSNTCSATGSSKKLYCSGDNAEIDPVTWSCRNGNPWGTGETIREYTTDGSITTYLTCAYGATVTNGNCSAYATYQYHTYREIKIDDGNGGTVTQYQYCPSGINANKECTGGWVDRQ